jgi:uncharacterized protein YdcH (DUF465 family)
MDTVTVENLKEQLMSINPEFRELVNEHGRFEARLSELSSLAFPTDEEQWEETTLKKKKLAIKDQIYELMAQHQRGQTAAH